MIGVPGRTINPANVVTKIAELHSAYAIQGIAFDRDPKHMDELLRVLEREGLGEGVGPRLVPWGQGHVSMDVAVKALEAAVMDRTLEHDGNPLLTWNISNAAVDWNREGNMRKLIKLTPRFRIDLAVCLAMALGLKVTEAASTGPQNPWDNPDFDYGKWAFS